VDLASYDEDGCFEVLREGALPAAEIAAQL